MGEDLSTSCVSAFTYFHIKTWTMMLMHLRPVKVDEGCFAVVVVWLIFIIHMKIIRAENLGLISVYSGEGLLLSGKYK